MARFEDVLTIKNGRSHKNVENPNGKYPIYGSGGIMGYADNYLCNSETVIIGRKGSINKPIYVTEPFWNVDTAFGLVANSDLLIPKYLYYFCEKFDFEKLNTTVTIPSLTKANLLKININIPPMEEQKKIAEILDKASDLISLRKKQIEKLDLLVKARFIEVFGEQILNPMGWKKGTIRDVVSEVSYGTSKPAVENGEYTYLRMNNITYDGHLDLSNLKYIDMTSKEFDKYEVKKGDILFNRTNSKELVGKTCVFKEDKSMVIAGYIIRVRTNCRANPEYISAILNSSYGKKTLFEMCKAIVGQANINAQELQNIKILIPPIELQNLFADFVQQVEKQKAKLKQGLEKLELTYKALMQQYFN